MTGQEYLDAIQALGMDNRDANELFLGQDAYGRTSRRWATGKNRVPRAVELLLRIMASQGWTAQEVAQFYMGYIKKLPHKN